MKLRILVADQFESLVSGKMIAIGLFPDAVVVVRPDRLPDGSVEQVPFQINLSVLCTMTEVPEVTAPGSLAIHAPAPEAERVAHLDMGVVTGVAGKSLSVPGRLAPFIIPRAGVYTVRAQVGEATAGAEFEVRVEPLPPAVAEPAPGAAPVLAKSTRKRKAGV